MARPRNTNPPAYRCHRASGEAVVTLDGQDRYLGEHGTPESRARYDEIIGQWLANGRKLPPPAPANTRPSGMTIVELCDRYRLWARTEYGDSKRSEYADVLDVIVPMVRLFGRLPVSQFGPNALREVRQTMIDGKHRLVEEGKPTVKPLSRSTINNRVHRIRRIFRWGASHQLFSSVIQLAEGQTWSIADLENVEPLRKGKGTVKESPAVKPVPESIVDSTLHHLSSPIDDMVRLQQITGMRSGELVTMRGIDIDRSGKVWSYRPGSHKTEYRGACRSRDAVSRQPGSILRTTTSWGAANVPNCGFCRGDATPGGWRRAGVLLQQQRTQ